MSEDRNRPYWVASPALARAERFTLADVFAVMSRRGRPPLTDRESTLIWDEVERLFRYDLNAEEANAFGFFEEEAFDTLFHLRRDDCSFLERARHRLSPLPDRASDDNDVDDDIRMYSILAVRRIDCAPAVFAPLLHAIAIDRAPALATRSTSRTRIVALHTLQSIAPGTVWLREALDAIAADKQVDWSVRWRARRQAAALRRTAP